MSQSVSYGWTCPKCGTVYAPHVERCGNCLPQPVQASNTLASTCRICGQSIIVCRGTHTYA